MKRRECMALIGLAIVPGLARAQPAKVPAIGVLIYAHREPFLTVFAKAMAEFGYIDGKTMRLEIRAAEGDPKKVEAMAEELVRLGVDLIVASETPAVAAAKKATVAIPIVMAPAGDPVGTGLIDSLSRPGGNITGLSAAAAELAGKCVELARDLLPGAAMFAALAHADNPFTASFLREIAKAAAGIGVKVDPVHVRSDGELEAGFRAAAQRAARAAIIQPSLPIKPAADLALKYRLPSLSVGRQFTEAGGLVSYGTGVVERVAGAARYVDRILKGALPRDLPVQRPTKFEMLINMRTARAIGITVPPSLVGQADEVIE